MVIFSMENCHFTIENGDFTRWLNQQKWWFNIWKATEKGDFANKTHDLNKDIV